VGADDPFPGACWLEHQKAIRLRETKPAAREVRANMEDHPWFNASRLPADDPSKYIARRFQFNRVDY